MDGDARVLLDVVPDHFIKCFAIKIEATEIFFLEFFLEDELSLDTSVICAWQPERALAAHAVVAHHDVLKSHKHSVADVKGIIGVGWGHDDSEGLLGGA